jgi:hypothetical protein
VEGFSSILVPDAEKKVTDEVSLTRKNEGSSSVKGERLNLF